MAGATGLEPATFGVTGRRSKPTELRPRGRFAELNSASSQVKARRAQVLANTPIFRG
jgi:hypothetical protein